jgi:serine/threonine-protein kinase RsbT
MDRDRRQFELINSFDVVTARQYARELARDLGFGLTDQTRIATAVSEVSRRALESRGVISLAVVQGGSRRGLECICRGCPVAGKSSDPGGDPLLGGTLGIERLMDDLEWRTSDDGQVVIVMHKWLH